MLKLLIFSYRNRFWKKSFFSGLDLVKDALKKQYGEGVVTPAEAALRWLKHHSGLIDDGKFSCFDF